MVLFGFDPGGAGSFGWAALRIGRDGIPADIDTGLAGDAPDAIQAAYGSTGIEPNAVGIDAPLFWVATGDRRADAKIRTRVCASGGKGGTVGHVNSLRGACLVQGIFAARDVAERWPEALVTEAHPKALMYVWPLLQEFLSAYLPAPISEHERDALIATYSAWALADRFEKWEDLVAAEESPFFPSGHHAAYWFPRLQT